MQYNKVEIPQETDNKKALQDTVLLKKNNTGSKKNKKIFILCHKLT